MILRSVDRLVGNEPGHLRAVAALVPDIADLDQGTAVIDNPCQLIPRLHCRIIQCVEHQGKQPMDGGNFPGGRNVKSPLHFPTDDGESGVSIDPTTSLVTDLVSTIPGRLVKDPRSDFPRRRALERTPTKGHTR